MAEQPFTGYAEAILRASDVGVVYAGTKGRNIQALAHFSLALHAGEIVGILGGRGSGKSVALQVLFGRESADTGRVEFSGHTLPWNLSLAQTARHEMQLVPQDTERALDARATVVQCVGEGLRWLYPKRSSAEIAELAGTWIERVGLGPGTRARDIADLSAGEKQRVALARALAFQPRVLGLDTPFTHVDAAGRAQLTNLLLDLQSEQHWGIVIASQQLDWLRFVSQRFVVLYLGRSVESGPSSVLETGPAHPYTRALLAAQRHVGAKRKLHLVLEGAPPEAHAPPAGCHFHTRCPRARRGTCDAQIPALMDIPGTPGHRVACFFPHSRADIS